MKKQSLDKTKHLFKLGETVFAVVQKDNIACLVEGKICSVSKSFDDENAEVKYTIDRGVYDSTIDLPVRFFVIMYDDIFKDLETAQQRATNTITINYEKMKESLLNTFNTIKTNSEKPKVTET